MSSRLNFRLFGSDVARSLVRKMPERLTLFAHPFGEVEPAVHPTGRIECYVNSKVLVCNGNDANESTALHISILGLRCVGRCRFQTPCFGYRCVLKVQGIRTFCFLLIVRHLRFPRVAHIRPKPAHRSGSELPSQSSFPR